MPLPLVLKTAQQVTFSGCSVGVYVGSCDGNDVGIVDGATEGVGVADGFIKGDGVTGVGVEASLLHVWDPSRRMGK